MPKSQKYEEMPGSVMSSLRQKAKRSGENLTVTAKYLWDLYVGQNRRCAMAGVPISFEDGTAVLDRIDYNKGFVEGNLHWAGLDYVKIRGRMTLDEMFYWCGLVVKHNEEKGKKL